MPNLQATKDKNQISEIQSNKTTRGLKEGPEYLDELDSLDSGPFVSRFHVRWHLYKYVEIDL